jgi:hypothetical protein
MILTERNRWVGGTRLLPHPPHSNRRSGAARTPARHRCTPRSHWSRAVRAVLPERPGGWLVARLCGAPLHRLCPVLCLVPPGATARPRRRGSTSTTRWAAPEATRNAVARRRRPRGSFRTLYIINKDALKFRLVALSISELSGCRTPLSNTLFKDVEMVVRYSSDQYVSLQCEDSIHAAA